MGCDIHVCFEQNIDGVWTNIDEYKEHDYMDEDPDLWREEIYSGRNYYLFATLADVRNWGGEVDCMCQPKGFPDDADEQTRKDYEKWEGDAHSPSWHTLYDLAEFNRTSDKYGLIFITDEFKDAGDNYIHKEAGYIPPIEAGPLEELLDSIYKRLVKMDVKNIIPEIQKQYRIVFWFDN